MLSAEDMHRYLTQRAAEDSDFRRGLIADPKGALHQEFGIEIPDHIEIHVHQSDFSTVHVVLPPDQALDEEQLEAISAGMCCCGI
ncbi:MAG: NHLP leader peptide family RiPP precursor [Gammaproteobacteria bacterium]|nr:NHLP leader peptide family RiPP precursor [Gammaproteobacteria bacterium]